MQVKVSWFLLKLDYAQHPRAVVYMLCTVLHSYNVRLRDGFLSAERANTDTILAVICYDRTPILDALVTAVVVLDVNILHGLLYLLHGTRLHCPS